MVKQAGSSKGAILPIVFFLSFCYLALLVSSTQRDIFFSGDGGMKYVIIQQVVRGEGFKYLHLGQPQWVKDIWSAGFFPFRKPFVYPSSEGYLFSFPPFFQLVNAVLYRAFGYWGLYVLPFASALLLWLCFVRVLLRFGVSRSVSAVALAVLVFATPLTLYGAVYWEHLPAVLLLFGGVSFLLDPSPSVFRGVLAGLVCGMAVWLRPEALVMDALYGAAALWLFWRRQRSVCVGFGVGMVLPIVAFFIFNFLNYGAVMGVHSYQVLEDQSKHSKLLKGGFYFVMINWINFLYFPFVILLVPGFFLLWKRRWEPVLPVRVLVLVAVAFCLLAPFVMPNAGGRQLGARYFLPVLPVLVAAGALVAAGRLDWSVWGKVLLGVGLIWGVGMNVVKGGIVELCKSNRDRIKPAYAYVRSQRDSVIVVNSEYIPQELSVLFDKYYFFLAPTDSSRVKVEGLLKKQGVVQYLFVSESAGEALLKKGDYHFGTYIIK